MLTRNFYSLDEVQAVLLHKPSLFWCKELLVSGCIGEAISILFQSWLWNNCILHIPWLVHAWTTLSSDQLTEDDILFSAYNLSIKTRRDNSLWNILILTIKDPDKMPDTVTRKTPHFARGDEKEMYFMRAIFQGKARCAWWISQYIKDIWPMLDLFAEHSHKEYKICLEALKGYEKLLGYRSDEYDIITRCAAVIILCIKESFEPLHDMIQYDHHPRKYEIPTHLIYGITLRGRMNCSQNNFIQLYNFEKYIKCPFWDDVVIDDEFYETYFPNDIPDEWTLHEKEKSHGKGILAPNEKVSIWKYSRNFMSNTSRFASNKEVNKYLKTLDVDSIENLIKIYNVLNPVLNPILNVCLKPVRKILIC